ncbi:MAG: type II secretion system protein GspG [Deltaproteobacteria bacterium]|nr:type II secretion system protein GspG [Deltaproteobacteria bacterium]
MLSSRIILLVLFLAGGAAALLLARRQLSEGAHDPAIRAQRQLGAIQMGLERFTIDTGRYPTLSEGIGALILAPYEFTAEIWRGPYIEARGADPLVDPWNRPYAYEVLENGRGMAFTLGADGAPGGEGENRDLMGVSEVMRESAPAGRRKSSGIDTLMGKPAAGDN